jgi:hypothetical protein
MNLLRSNNANRAPPSFVDLLNANAVNIDSEPLDSYGDGEDMEEDDEGG